MTTRQKVLLGLLTVAATGVAVGGTSLLAFGPNRPGAALAFGGLLLWLPVYVFGKPGREE